MRKPNELRTKSVWNSIERRTGNRLVGYFMLGVMAGASVTFIVLNVWLLASNPPNDQPSVPQYVISILVGLFTAMTAYSWIEYKDPDKPLDDGVALMRNEVSAIADDAELLAHWAITKALVEVRYPDTMSTGFGALAATGTIGLAIAQFLPKSLEAVRIGYHFGMAVVGVFILFIIVLGTYQGIRLRRTREAVVKLEFLRARIEKSSWPDTLG